MIPRSTLLSSVIFELIGTVISVAKELGPLRPQLGDLNHHRLGVEFASFVVSRQRRPHDLLAQTSVLHRAKYGLTAGVLQTDNELALLVVRLGGCDRC